MNELRLAIIGSGALGSLFAALLSPHARLVMLGHWPAQIAHLREGGLTLIQPDGRRSTHRFPVTDDPADVPAVDLALVLVKSYQTAAAAAEIKQFLRPHGLAVTLQNGLGNVEILAGVLGSDRAAQGVTAAGATMVEPGLVRFAGHGPTHLAVPKGSTELITALARLLRAAGLETGLAADLDGLVWGKLAISSAINPLTALLRVPNGFLAENDLARQLMFAAARETGSVAEAMQIELPYADPAQRALEVARGTAANRSSMLQDILRGAETEIEAICGAVVAHGRRVNTGTPLNEEFLRLVSSLPDRSRGAPVTSTIGGLEVLLERRNHE